MKTTYANYYFVTIEWDFVRSGCIVYAKSRESAVKKAQKTYPAYKVLEAREYDFIK